MGLRLPEGTSRVALDYLPDAWDRLGIAMTLVTIGLILVPALVPAARVDPNA